MRCHYCYNDQFVIPEKLQNVMKDLISEPAFFNFLQSRKHLIEGVVICGWEPTIQADLIPFIQAIKEQTGLCVKLDTNGRQPHMVKQLIDEHLVDYVAMDVKYAFDDYERLAWVREDMNPYEETIHTLMNSDIEYEFRTTVIKWYHTNAVLESIGEMINGAKRYVLQQFLPDRTLNPHFMGSWFSLEEMNNLKLLMSPYAQECLVRV